MGKLAILMSVVMLLSSQVMAVDSVRLNPDNDLVVNAQINGVTFPLNSEEPSGDATADTGAAALYVPMELAGGGLEHFIEPLATDIFNASDFTRLIQFPLYINVGATDKYLYAAATKSEGTASYELIKFDPGGNPYKNRTNNNITFSISPADICLQTADCAEFATLVVNRGYKLYFFLSAITPNTLPLGTIIDPANADYSGGIYFDVKMSNRTYDSNAARPIISEVKVGDRRLIIKYSSTSGILNPLSVRIYNHPLLPIGENQPIKDVIYTGSLTAEEYSYAVSGEITLRNLKNGTEYLFSVLFVDKYKFGTVLSDDAKGTPLEIQELLKKESCFLLTAGFGEEHYVIDYFRKFRDRVLSKYTLGRIFITNYYKYAPKYALVVYENQVVRFGIRSISYGLYFIFNYFYYLSAVIFLMSAGYFYFKSQKKRIDLLENRL